MTTKKQLIVFFLFIPVFCIAQTGKVFDNLTMESEIPHEFRIRDGEHNWTYWRASLPEVLNFISIGFHQGTD